MLFKVFTFLAVPTAKFFIDINWKLGQKNPHINGNFKNMNFNICFNNFKMSNTNIWKFFLTPFGFTFMRIAHINVNTKKGLHIEWPHHFLMIHLDLRNLHELQLPFSGLRISRPRSFWFCMIPEHLICGPIYKFPKVVTWLSVLLIWG